MKKNKRRDFKNINEFMDLENNLFLEKAIGYRNR
jgi:hypothetical protein